jgi:cyclopropane-fatty-acyl-phospholipid synthase
MRLLSHLLRRFVRNGRLVVTDYRGERHVFGSGENGPDVAIRFTDAAVEREIFFNPELKAAEAYMDGRMVFEGGSRVFDFLKLFSVNRKGLASHPVQKVLRDAWRATRRLQQRNTVARSAANAKHHYDIPPAFYKMWLDPTLTYSCAYFRTPEDSLHQAQINKIDLIATKLALQPGMRVVDIGCGYGALAIRLAKIHGCEVVGISLSPEQLGEARARAVAEGVADRVTFLEQDYRQLEGTFDRVVSVGMMEHVGVANYETFFQTIRRLLKPKGFALVHCIGKVSQPGSTGPFIRKYIFPGGYSPSLSEVFTALERTYTWCSDVDVLRLHYYWTIKHWREAYEARRDEAVAMMGERFCRMWDFYLAAVELGFLDGSNFVFQMLISANRDDVPVTRDFMLGKAEPAALLPAHQSA